MQVFPAGAALVALARAVAAGPGHEEAVFIAVGDGLDFFIVGEWENEEPIAEDDYIDGFYEEMKLKYDYVFAITGSAFYDIIPHFEVMAK